jgi:hypothetical protein
MPIYVRGSGGYKLTEAEFKQLEGIVAKQRDLIQAHPSDTGLGLPIYAALFNDISTIALGQDQATVIPKPGVDQAVWNFIKEAAGVNSNTGFVAGFATQYTADQFIERGGSASDAVLLSRAASNEIALNLGQDVLDHGGSVPGIEGIAVDDGGAGANTVFKQIPLYADTGDYAGWVGTLLFPYIGESNFYKNILLNTEKVSATFVDPTLANSDISLKNTPGAYDLVAALDANTAALVNLLPNPLNTINLNLLNYPAALLTSLFGPCDFAPNVPRAPPLRLRGEVERVAQPRPSNIARDGAELRRHAVGEVEKDFVHVAPAPAFRRVVALDHRMAGGVEMFGGVAVRRIVATADVPAGAAQPQVHPRRSHFQAFLAAARGRRHLANLVGVKTCGHDALPAGQDENLRSEGNS